MCESRGKGLFQFTAKATFEQYRFLCPKRDIMITFKWHILVLISF